MSKFSKAVEKVETFVEEHPILIGYLGGVAVMFLSSFVINRAYLKRDWNAAEAKGLATLGEGARPFRARDGRFVWFTPDD